MTLNPREMGLRIKNQRKLSNLTQESLAELLEVSPHYIYEIESGRKTVSLKILLALSKELRISTDYILYGNDYRIQVSPKLDKINDDTSYISKSPILSKSMHTIESVKSLDKDRLDKLIKPLSPKTRNQLADLIEVLLKML